MHNIQNGEEVLVLVTSPFQYLCALELIQQKYQSASVTIIDGSVKCASSSNQLQSLYKQYPPERIIPLKILFTGDLSKRIASYSWLAVKEKDKDYAAILIGDLRHQWMQDLACSIRSKQIYLVDDGAITIPLHEFVLKPRGFTIPIPMTLSSPERQEMATQLKLSQGMRIERKNCSCFPYTNLMKIVFWSTRYRFYAKHFVIARTLAKSGTL